MKLFRSYLTFTFLMLYHGVLFTQELEVNWHYKEEYREGFIFKLLNDQYDNSYMIYNLYRTGKNKIDSAKKYAQTDFMNTYFVKKLDHNGKELWDIDINRGKDLVSPLFNVNENGEVVIGRWEVNSDNRELKDYIIERYNTDGIFLGENRLIENVKYRNQCIIRQIIQNPDGSTLLNGGCRGNINIIGHADTTINFKNDDAYSFIIKLNRNQNFEWIKHFNHNEKKGISKIEVDDLGNVFFAGSFEKLTVKGEGIERISNREQHIFFGKLNAEGDSLVEKTFKGKYDGNVSDLKLDKSGNVYLLGTIKGQYVYFNEVVKNEFYWRLTTKFIMKMDETFNEIWVNHVSLDKSVGGGQVYFGKDNKVLWLGSFPAEHDYDPSHLIRAFRSTGSDYGGNYQTAIQTLNEEGNFLSLTLLPKDDYISTKVLCLNNEHMIIYGTRSIKNDKGQRLASELNVKHWSRRLNSSKLKSIRSCNSYYWPETKETYTESGSYMAKYQSKNGTDSILELNLTIEKSDLSLRHDEKKIYANARNVTYQWLDCNDNYRPIKGENDSVFQFRETGSYCVEVTSIYCDNVDTSECVHKEMVGIHPIDLSVYYDKDYDVLVSKIEREHIQLDPTVVKMIPFRDGPLYGFVKNGKKEKWLIQPRFEQVFAVYNEGAIVKDTSRHYRYGLVDKKGKYLIPPVFPNLFKENGVYHGIISVSSDTSLHRLGDHTGHYAHYYFNEKGKLLFYESAHDFESFFYEDYAWFRFGKIYYIYNKKGELVKEFKVNRNKHFNGVADNKLIFNEFDSCIVAYNIDGSVDFSLSLNTHRKTYQLDKNLFGILSGDADYYFCDSLGQSKGYSNTSNMIGMLSSDEGFFKQEQFVVRHNRLAGGVIDRSGKPITSFKYGYIGPLINGYRYCIDTLWRPIFIDSNGTELEFDDYFIPTVLDNYKDYALSQDYGFYDGLAVVLKHDDWSDSLSKINEETFVKRWHESEKYRYYNTNGEIVLVLSDSILDAGNFSDGLAPVLTANKKLGFIDKTGQWVIQPKYELSLAGAYPMPYIVVPYFQNGFAYIKSFKGYIDKEGNEYFSGKRMQDHYNFSH